MQFLILAYDAKDAEAPARRNAVRAAHTAMIDKYKASGNLHIGVAILSESGQMIGSCIVAEFPDRAGLQQWLDKEPYLIGSVWENVQIQPCQLGLSFIKKT